MFVHCKNWTVGIRPCVRVSTVTKDTVTMDTVTRVSTVTKDTVTMDTVTRVSTVTKDTVTRDIITRVSTVTKDTVTKDIITRVSTVTKDTVIKDIITRLSTVTKDTVTMDTDSPAFHCTRWHSHHSLSAGCSCSSSHDLDTCGTRPAENIVEASCLQLSTIATLSPEQLWLHASREQG